VPEHEIAAAIAAARARRVRLVHDLIGPVLQLPVARVPVAEIGPLAPVRVEPVMRSILAAALFAGHSRLSLVHAICEGRL
jgi:hypothetical protein